MAQTKYALGLKVTVSGVKHEVYITITVEYIGGGKSRVTAKLIKTNNPDAYYAYYTLNYKSNDQDLYTSIRMDQNPTYTAEVSGIDFNYNANCWSKSAQKTIEGNTGVCSAYENESELLDVTLSGSFADNNLKSVTDFMLPSTSATCKITSTIGSKSDSQSVTATPKTITYGTAWYSGLPNSASGTLTVKAELLIGTTVYKTVTKTLAVTIPDSVKPSISNYSVSDNDGYARYIKGVSAVKAAGTATAGTGSTMKSLSLKVGTMSAATKTDGTMPVSSTLTITGTVACVLTATDNRGRTATASVNITIYDKADLISIALSGTFAASNLQAVMSYVLPKSSGYSATATYTLGTKSETPSNLAVSTTKTFDDTWMDGIPDKTSGTLTVKVTIKQGTAEWTSKTATLAVTVPDTVKPSVSAFTVAERLTTVPSSWGIYVQGLSAVRINTLTYTTPHSSASKVTLKVGSATAKDGTASNWPVSDTITQSGTITCTVTITDARGRTGTKTADITVYAYSAPSFTSARSERCAADGTLNDEGTRFKVTTQTTFSDCNGKNSVTLTVEVKPSTSSSYGSPQTIAWNTSVVTNATISANAAYDVRLTLTDQFNTAYHYDYISTALYLIHFKTGGTGIAFGQKATIEDMFDCNFKTTFRKTVTFTKSGGGTVTIDQILNKIGL